MKKILKKTEVTFAIKISVLLMLVLFASSLKKNKKTEINSLAGNSPIELSTGIFTIF